MFAVHIADSVLCNDMVHHHRCPETQNSLRLNLQASQQTDQNTRCYAFDPHAHE